MSLRSVCIDVTGRVYEPSTPSRFRIHMRHPMEGTQHTVATEPRCVSQASLVYPPYRNLDYFIYLLTLFTQVRSNAVIFSGW